MQSNDAIEVVAPLGGGISEVTLFPDAAAVLAGTAGVLAEPGRIFHAAGRHLSSLESDVALFVRRVEIPVVGEGSESGDQRTPPGSRHQSRSTDANRERRDPRHSV